MLLASTSWGNAQDPQAVMLHGAIDAATTWSAIGPWFAEHGWHAIAVDLRGHGGSQVFNRRDTSLGAMAADVVETVDSVCGDRRAVDVILGHSLGTLVALSLVSSSPRFARGLVLEDPPGASLDWSRLAAANYERMTFARSFPTEARRQVLDAAPKGADADEIEAKLAAIAAADADYVRALLMSLCELDSVALARGCELPSLVVVGRDKGEPVRDGSKDFTTFSALSGQDRTRFCNALANVTLATCDAGHDLHVEPTRTQFLTHLRGWLSKDGRQVASKAVSGSEGNKAVNSTAATKD